MSTLTLFVTCLVTWLRIFQDLANHCTVYKALCHTRKYGLNILINLMILKDAAPDSRDTIKISHISHPCDKVVRAGLQKSGNFFMTCAKGGGSRVPLDFFNAFKLIFAMSLLSVQCKMCKNAARPSRIRGAVSKESWKYCHSHHTSLIVQGSNLY